MLLDISLWEDLGLQYLFKLDFYLILAKTLKKLRAQLLTHDCIEDQMLLDLNLGEGLVLQHVFKFDLNLNSIWPQFDT